MMDESRQLRASIEWVSVFAREWHREGGQAFVPGNTGVELACAWMCHRHFGQPRTVGDRSPKGK